MALIFEPFYSTNFWMTNMAIAYYAGSADFGNGFLSMPAYAKENIGIPIFNFYKYILTFYISIWECIFMTPEVFHHVSVYWSIRATI